MIQWRSAAVFTATFSLCIAAAQPADRLEFEVGTVKVSNPGQETPFGPLPSAPGFRNGIFNAKYMTLRTLLAYAYDVSQPQVSGPGWLERNHYDIAAKVPEGAQKSEVREMLRKFLAERFKVAAHSATREMDALALVVAEGGTKLRKLEIEESFTPHFPNDGGVKLYNRGDMRSWAEFLTRQIGSPVLDQTGLAGSYAGTIAYAPDVETAPSGYPGLPQALKEQAGLELVKRKLSVKLIVVDHAEEVPEEN